jgi:predicted ATP-dependent protease
MNQKGEIQVVGGVTEKIEGFYHVCKQKGLTGDQGVILPKNNLRNLILEDEVNEAIKAGKFKLYPVERVEEAVEIILGVKFEEVKEKVIAKLKKFYDLQCDNKEE